MQKLFTSASRFYARLQEWRLLYFPERQLFLRSEGRVRFLTIHSYTQVAAATALLVATGWGALTSYAYLSRDFLIEDKNKTISAMSADYQELSSDFSALEAEVERRANLLEERQQFLQELISSAPKDTPSLLPLPIEEAASEQVSQPETEALDDSDEEISTEKLSFFEEFFDTSPDELQTPTNPERRKTLLSRLQQLEKAQRSVASLLEKAVAQKLQNIDEVVQPSGVTVDKLLAQAEGQNTAIGGPFVPEPSFEGIFTTTDGVSFENLRENFDRLKMVTNALDSYPHGKPAKKYYVSSRFGSRIDPIKKVRSRHYALDLSGWPGEPIMATAPGKVVKSGSVWPYGNMVEIDHGNGFRTRYGHMRKLNVKKDEEVKLGQQLGEMGSTGRVTGTHVHYEVWFNGKVIDPMPFMKAAEHVLEIQGRYEKTSEQSD
ncbi:M23 family metallopeptidase [Kordiimonas aquimaris]|uniref:M23 family metallopeptidase n=1 Tax=Kordiimonas aquimaris TaxID=707591 RepID=UPI0021D338CE|nr:M23 family metallopeptidase [Kordiimonas aquimaris]